MCVCVCVCVWCVCVCVWCVCVCNLKYGCDYVYFQIYVYAHISSLKGLSSSKHIYIYIYIYILENRSKNYF